MQKRLLLLSLLTMSNLMGLSMDEAVEKALNQSHLLKSQAYKIDGSKATEEVLGSAYKPTLSTSYQYSKRDFQNFMRLRDESNFNISLDYNLFNGFYDKYTLESQEHLTQSQKWLLQSNIADLKQLTQQRYLDLLQALKSQTVQDEAVALLENQLKDTQNFLNQGLIDRSKYLKVKVELQSAQQAQLQAKSSVTNAKNALSSLIQEPIVLTELQEASKNEVNSGDFNTLYNSSLVQRSELKYLEALKESQEANIEAVNSVYYPKVGLALDYNRYGEELIPNGVTYGTLGSMKNKVVGSIKVSYDLYSGGKAQNEKTVYKSQALSLAEDIEKTKLDIKLQLQEALEQLKVTQGQIEVAQSSIEEAQEHYRITQNRYKQQLDSTTDLLDAGLLLTTAKNNLTVAEYNHLRSMVNIERIVQPNL